MSKLKDALSRIAMIGKARKSFEKNELNNMGAGEADERK